MSKRRSLQEKASIVVKYFITNISVAELRRNYNVSPVTFKNLNDNSSREVSKPSLTMGKHRRNNELVGMVTPSA